MTITYPPTLDMMPVPRGRRLRTIVLACAATVLCVCGCGCTSTATRAAINSYEKTDDAAAAAFNNAMRIADEQLYLNFMQFAEENWFRPEKLKAAFRAVWEARRGLEDMRLQFERGRTLSRVTVGQYLYDRQGSINVLMEDQAKQLGLYEKAGTAANQKTGVTSVLDTIPADLKEKINAATQPVTAFEKALKANGVNPDQK